MKRLLSMSLICGLVSSLSAANFDTKVSLGASSATGLGYGASLEYKINNNVAIEGSYKTTNMRYSTNDYEYSTSNFAVKFNY